MLSPGSTNLVMAVTPLALAGTSFFAQAVSVVLGVLCVYCSPPSRCVVVHSPTAFNMSR